jgi:hypothetical protein
LLRSSLILVKVNLARKELDQLQIIDSIFMGCVVSCVQIEMTLLAMRRKEFQADGFLLRTIIFAGRISLLESVL